jgi:hypothetical protein
MITEVAEQPLVDVKATEKANVKADEIDFAYLTGFQPEVLPDAVGETNDVDEDEDLDPEEHRTIRGLISSPFSKIALVGGAGLFGFLLVGLFMNSVMSSSAKPLDAKSGGKDANTVVASTLDPKDAEIAKFKTDLALGTQLSAGKSKTLRPAVLPKADSKLNGKDKDKPDANATKSSDRALESPVISNLSAPPLASAPIYPVRQIMSPVEPMVMPSRVFAASPPAEIKNPAEEWQRLASIGSYGNLAAPSEMSKAIAPNPAIASNVSTQSLVIEKPRSDSLTSYLAQSEKSLQATSANTLLVGTTARASLKTALVFSTDGSRVIGSAPGLIPKFIVTLQEAISTADGKVAIPANASLIVVARPLDAKSGLSELDVVGIVINGRELTPPANAITIRGADGAPLIADKYFDRGSEISGMDVGTFLTSALAEVGKLTNSPTSTSSISTLGGSSTVNTAPPPNYLGAALSGGFGILSETLNRRSQQALEEIKTRPNVFFIPAGKELQVFVNQSVTF